MRLLIGRADLSRVISSVARVVEARNTIAILSNIRLVAEDGRLTVTGTDLDIEATASVAADISVPGSCCVDAKLIADIAKKAGGDVAMELDDGRLTIKSGRSAFKLATLPARDFPTLDGGKYDATFDIDLAALFAPVAFAISTEETRYYLNGVFFRGGTSVAVATDGHRLAKHNGPDLPDFNGIIVPRKTVGMIPKGSVNVSVSSSKIRIQTADLVLVSKLIDGTFPDYDRVIPRDNDKVIFFKSDEMRAAADRVSVVSSERGRAVRLDFGVGSATLTVNSPDSGSAVEEISVGYAGDPVQIGFNAKYLSEVVGIFPSGDIQMALADGGSPAVLKSDKAEGLLAVIMPMRV